MLVLREVPRSGVRLSAGLAGAETTTALAIAHTAAGGEAPSAGWLLAVAATAYGASLLVLRRRAPVRLVLPAMVALQVLMHAWLVALTTDGAIHSHGAGPDVVVGLSWPMLLAHVGAGLVAAVAWVLRRRAVEILIGWSEHARPAVPLRRRVATEHHPAGIAGRIIAARPTRGPPGALRAAA